MKTTIELNGVANMKLLLEGRDNSEIPKTLRKALNHQLDVMERYMVELARSLQEGRENAPWHEVRDNPDRYPLNGGRR